MDMAKGGRPGAFARWCLKYSAAPPEDVVAGGPGIGIFATGAKDAYFFAGSTITAWNTTFPPRTTNTSWPETSLGVPLY